MKFTLCENTGFFLRLGLLGPSGSGKSYTALRLATELGDKVGIIDTENRSARRYARAFGKRFYSIELEKFGPDDYIEAIHAAEQAGFDVLVIDSLSHAWMGKGGVLELVDQSARRQARGGTPNSFNGWREVTPAHNRLVEAMVRAKLHLIVTMRVKTDYIVEKDDKGKSVPRKVGLAPVQRDGLEYEFDVVGDLSPEHDLVITKTRCSKLAGAVIPCPGAELAQTLRGWLDGVEEPEPEPEPEQDGEDQDASPHDPPRPQVSELDVIEPWLRRIREAEQGSEEQLDAVRDDMNKLLKRRTKGQGEALRRAIENARAAIQARNALPGGPGRGPQTQEQAQSA